MNIPVRLKFIIIALLIILFSGLAGITFLHTENTIENFQRSQLTIDSYFSEIHVMDEQLMLLAFLSNDDRDSARVQEELVKFNHSTDQFISAMDRLLVLSPEAEKEVTGSIDSIKQLSADLRVSINQAVSDTLTDLMDITTIAGYHDVIDQLYIQKAGIQKLIYQQSLQTEKRLKWNAFLVLVLCILFVLASIFTFAFSFDKALHKITGFIKVLERGGKPDKIYISTGDELQSVSEGLNSYLEYQDSIIHYLKSIGEGVEISESITNRGDLLGKELMVMASRLNKVRREEKERQEEEKKRSWKTDGIAQFGEILRSERENVQELSFRIIQKLVTYLGTEMGTLFLASTDEQDDPVLEILASYAYDRRKYMQKSFKFGEGLPGTCALEKEKIYINEVPEDYSDVITGVGQTKPRFVLLVPMKIEDEIFGVIELASFRELEEHELAFIDDLAETIASTLAGVKTNEKTASLLKQSQLQAEQLIRQENEMKINMEALEKAQEESRKKETEITGILNAMNESSLVAEFDSNGRFLKINDKFLALLESPKEQILGKHHHEFAIVEKYSDNYKAFWKSLRNGEIVSTSERYKLYSGKELWLQQTYTPILNEGGEVFKILNIAVDITNSKQQQEHLERQAAEITRKSLEMEGLNDAVNRSIIKCELDNNGIILDLNKNYSVITGFNRKELLGRNYRLFLKEMEKEQFEKIWSEVLKDKTYEGAIRRTKPTGEEIWLMATFSPVKDEDGTIYKIYFLALDITEKRLKYQLLEEANREVERLRDELRKYEG